jgi:hypothetical protein
VPRFVAIKKKLFYNGCFFKFGVEVGVKLSIVYTITTIQVTDHGSAVQILHFYTNGAISIDSPMPAWTPNLKKHPFIIIADRSINRHIRHKNLNFYYVLQ